AKGSRHPCLRTLARRAGVSGVFRRVDHHVDDRRAVVPLRLFDGGLELLDLRRALAPRAERGGRGGNIHRTVADAAVGKTPPFLRDLDQAQGAVVVDNSYEMNAVPHARLEI